MSNSLIISINTELSVLIECIALIYFSNSVMQYRNSRTKSNLLIIIGYAIYGVICAFYVPVLNILSFIIINFIVLYLGFSDSVKTIALRVIILTAIMMFWELVFSLLTDTKIEQGTYGNINPVLDAVMVIFSKTMYFISLVMLKRFAPGRSGKSTPEMVWLIPLPICSCLFFMLFNKMFAQVDYGAKAVFIILGVMLIATNFAVYIICDRIVERNARIQYLQEVEHKNEIDFQKYNLLKEKYADLRVMAHDFNKYCKSIEGMLGENSDAALEMIRSLESKNRSLLLVEYTDNDALNVLLTQKSEECAQNGIDFQIYIQNVSLSFINEADTVAIFANLMDNAIEASGKSAAKKIFLSIYEMNGAFTVIRLDNSADSEPVTEGGALMTSKSDKALHGIGTVSIKQALKKYGGDMEWSYDRDEKKFNTTILINNKDFSKKN